MNVFVIGGTGFLGYHAVHELLRRGHRPTVLALPPAPPPGTFPPEVQITLADLTRLSDEEVLALLAGHEGVVYAAGADDRVVPRAPAYDFFYNANVRPTARLFALARRAGVKRGVLLSSYFAYFDRIWPELRLADHHPYVCTRQEQECQALEAAGTELSLSILELPYIFGSAPGRVPLWAPLIAYLRSPLPVVFYPRGGTNMIAVRHVAEAIAGALERGQRSERYVVGEANLTWAEWLTRLTQLLGRPKRVVTVPDWMVTVGLWGVHVLHRLQGREGGLDPVQFARMQARNTFFDPEPARQALGFGQGGLDEALAETVKASVAASR